MCLDIVVTVARVVYNTVSVAQLVELINRRNRFSQDDPPVRQGWNSIVEEILLRTGNYKGFKLLGPGEVPVGHLPGLVNEGSGDQTRRFWRL